MFCEKKKVRHVYLILLCSFFIFGCRSKSLHPRWKPLEKIEENWLIPDDRIVTIGSCIYVRSFDDWKENFPPRSYKRRAVLIHEKVHSERQFKHGTLSYICNYIFDINFRWHEEQQANYKEYKYLQEHRQPINIEVEAHTLSGDIYFNMVTYEYAKTWVKEALSGKWKPDE